MIDTALQRKIYRPSNLMELFYNSYALLKYVWKEILILSAVVLGPVYVLCGLVIKAASSTAIPQIRAFFESSQETSASFSSTFWPLYAKIMLFAILLSVILMVAHVLVILAINLLAFRRIRGEVIGPKEALKEALRFLPKVLLQKILLGLIILGLSLAFGLGVALFAFISALISPVLTGFLAVILYIAFICFITKLVVSYSFAEQTILFEESTATESFAESASLVRGSWWRVFGISMLVSIVVSFAAQLVSTPIITVSLLPALNKIYEFILSAQYGNADSAAAGAFLTQYMESIQRVMPVLFLGQAVSVLISMLFTPVFMLLFYMDLRARKEPWKINSDASAGELGSGLETRTANAEAGSLGEGEPPTVTPETEAQGGKAPDMDTSNSQKE